MSFRADEETKADPRLTPDPSRVARIGEVFTPTWLVGGILDVLPEGELERVEATCLDPACGHGQFLLETLRRKLNAIGGPDMAPDAYRNASITALTRVYGVDIDQDNVADARRRIGERLHRAHRDTLGTEAPADWARAVDFVLRRNIVRADFLEDDFPLTEFRQTGTDGCFLLVTTRFSDQLPDTDPRRQPLFAGQATTEGPFHWRAFDRQATP